ncbi:MAG: short-chain dehydrogenase [Crocinitomicaceae bacterium]|nr:short-chain dehydrogenase [Crocinitomicaceae bacterium]|tara:strand:- start:43011 stop:43742 length:732 start_codon:yes stop_codon:yes gene_type:complete
MKSALILGASSDIANACSELLARQGYHLTLAARREGALRTLKSDLEIRFKVSVSTQVFDALDFDSHRSFYQGLSNSPDVVICAFGILGNQEQAEKDWEQCKEILDANFTGAVSILNIVANDMASKGSGTIIGISSVAGERGRMSNYVYGSAKAGFTTYLSGLRNRLHKKGVNVLTVKPGFVQTKMTENLPLPKPLTAQPEQVAKAILKAAKKGKSEIYILGIWRWIMLIIRNIPEFIFKKLSL